MIHFIYASNSEGLIGIGNQLPWHDKEEFGHFKEVTKNHVVVMGYRTWESLNKKPLPHRRNLIVVNDENKNRFTDITDIVNSVTVDELVKSDKEKPYINYFIIGGANTFKLFEPYVNGKVYHSVLTNNDILLKQPNEDGDETYYQPSKMLQNKMRLVNITTLTNFSVYEYVISSI